MYIGLFTVLLISFFATPNALAQNRIGGHLGVVQPLITVTEDRVTNFIHSDMDYSLGFPMGITVRKSEKFAFDLEFVPVITFLSDAETSQEKINFLIHPGLLWGVNDRITVGNRFAFELGENGRYGITPLLNIGGVFNNGFVEFVFPIRVGSDQGLALTAGVHWGIGF